MFGFRFHPFLSFFFEIVHLIGEVVFRIGASGLGVFSLEVYPKHIPIVKITTPSGERTNWSSFFQRIFWLFGSFFPPPSFQSESIPSSTPIAPVGCQPTAFLAFKVRIPSLLNPRVANLQPS